MSTWKEIEGYNRYLVSEFGQVLNKETGRIIKQHYRLGYLFTRVCKNGIAKKFYSHRLVAAAFIPNPENKPQVNHKNGIRDDNRVENLEWCTSKENIAHSFLTRLAPSGSKKYNSKLVESDIKIIRSLSVDGVSDYRIAKVFDVNQKTIWMITNGERWRHVV